MTSLQDFVEEYNLSFDKLNSKLEALSFSNFERFVNSLRKSGASIMIATAVGSFVLLHAVLVIFNALFVCKFGVWNLGTGCVSLK